MEIFISIFPNKTVSHRFLFFILLLAIWFKTSSFTTTKSTDRSTNRPDRTTDQIQFSAISASYWAFLCDSRNNNRTKIDLISLKTTTTTNSSALNRSRYTYIVRIHIQ